MMSKKISPKKYLVWSCEELERLNASLGKYADRLSPYQKRVIEDRIVELKERIETLKGEIEADANKTQ
jgi:hypothetical protein